jgi:hypothetical protein
VLRGTFWALAAVGLGSVACSSILGLGDFQDAHEEPSDSGADQAGAAGQAGAGGVGAGGGVGANGGASGTAGASGQAGTDGGGGGPSDVNGTQPITYVETPKPKIVFPDLSSIQPVALVPTANGFTTIPGLGYSNGSFTIPKVPVGPYYLKLDTPRYQNFYTVFTGRQIDMGYYEMGRDDAVASELGTTLTLSVTNMTPWTANDGLGLVSENAGLFAANLESIGSPKPGAGATQINLTFDMGKVPEDVPWHAPQLVNGGEGDVAYLGHLSHVPSPVPHLVLVEVAQLPSFTQTNLQTTSVSGSFATFTLDQSLSFDWKRDECAQLLTQANPNAVAGITNMFLGVLPGDETYGLYRAAPNLLEYVPSGTGEVSQTFSYGNPFPGWVLHAGFACNFGVQFQLPSTSSPATIPGSFGVFMPGDALGATVTVEPSVSPVAKPTVEGGDFFAGGTISTVTPTLAWQAPSLGQPSRYEVAVFWLSTSNGGTVQTLAGTIVTADTSVKIPTGLLQLNKTYAFRIEATVTTGGGLPLKGYPPGATADAISGMFTVN